MNFYAISALVNFFTSGILAVFVLSKNRKNKLNIGFFIFAFFIAFWSISYFFWQISIDAKDALFWSRMLMAGAIFIPVSYLQLVYLVVNLFDKRKVFLIFSYVVFVIFLILNFTKSFISHVEPLLGFEFWPIAGPVYSIFLIVWFLYVVYSTYLLFDKYRKSVGIIRLQIKYIVIGMIIGFVGGSTNYFLWYRIPILPFGNVLVSVYVGTVAYAILRYRLMDIRVIARKMFVYLGVAIFSYGIFYLLAWIYIRFFGGIFAIAGYVAGLIIAPVFVALFYGLGKYLLDVANKYFFFSLYNYQETINKLARELNYYTDLKKIVSTIVDTIKKTMQLNRAGVLLINQDKKTIHYSIAKVIGFNTQNGISLVKDNFLTRYLQKSQKPLVRDELKLLSRDAKSKSDSDSFANLHRNMEHIEASLCLPLMSNGRLIGIIVLGAKISGDAYTREDLDLLESLSNQAGTAIDNARLYDKIDELNSGLQQKVKEQTKDLRAKADHLKKLLEMRSEFLDIASHQLKTPVSVILGTISMFKEGSMDKLSPDRRQKFVNNIFHKAQKLSAIINDILRASEMDTDEFSLSRDNIKPEQIEDVIKAVYDDLKPSAQEKGIKLVFKRPVKPTTPIMIDADFLEQAIYNLVDNAIKYTQKGQVKLILSEADKKVILEIADSGIGIPVSDQKKMFDKFARAKNAVNMYTDGSGLGLFIVKKIVEAHPGGQVSFVSQENKGTTFTISFPVVKAKQ